jgi:hypothetical protein
VSAFAHSNNSRLCGRALVHGSSSLLFSYGQLNPVNRKHRDRSQHTKRTLAWLCIDRFPARFQIRGSILQYLINLHPGLAHFPEAPVNASFYGCAWAEFNIRGSFLSYPVNLLSCQVNSCETTSRDGTCSNHEKLNNFGRSIHHAHPIQTGAWQVTLTSISHPA